MIHARGAVFLAQGQRAVCLIILETPQVLRIIDRRAVGPALLFVDTHGVPPAAFFAVSSARTVVAARSLAVLVIVRLGITAPALRAVLGTDEPGAIAFSRASLYANVPEIRERRGGGVPQ